MIKEGKMIKRIFFLGLVVSILFCYTALVQGSDRTEEETRKRLEKATEEKAIEGKGKILIDWGSSLSYSYEVDKNEDKDWERYDRRSHIREGEIRPWVKISIRPDWAEGKKEYSEHILYLRILDRYNWERPRTLEDGDNNEGPKVDALYLDMDFDPVWVKAGRQFIELGTGITYAKTHDGLKIILAWNDWAISSFVSKTLPHEDNMDFSVPGSDRGSKRYFWGGEADYLGIDLHKFFIYYMGEKDNTLEVPENESQDYHYDAHYLGLGLKKEVESGFKYYLEVIGEAGKSYCRGSSIRSDIIAAAADAGVSYNWESFMKPSLALRYSMGTGDNSRGSVTETGGDSVFLEGNVHDAADYPGGNVYGNDHGFIYFGNYFAGLTVTPNLSNLQVLGCSLELSPFEKIKWFKDLSLGVDGYLFFKCVNKGVISDISASRHEREIGSELDIFADWALTENFSLGVEYGYFSPGKAYPPETNDPERYYRLSASYEF